MARPRAYITKRRKDARQRAWNSMRWLGGTFTLPDICATAEIGTTNAIKFLNSLEKFGYAQRIKERRRGYTGGSIVWRLVKNTGPLRPLERNNNTLYDQNTGEVVEAPNDRNRLDSSATGRLPSKQPGGHCEAVGVVAGDD